MSGVSAVRSELTGEIVASPVVGEGCFNPLERPYVIRMEVPVTAELMVAAIYGERDQLFDFDLASDKDLWEHVASGLVQEGLCRLEEWALEIREQRRLGTLAEPEWLELCRRRVADIIDPSWQAAHHRCPCGYAVNAAAAFGEHLSMAEGAEPEHFEVTAPEAIHRFWEREPALPRAVSLEVRRRTRDCDGS